MIRKTSSLIRTHDRKKGIPGLRTTKPEENPAAQLLRVSHTQFIVSRELHHSLQTLVSYGQGLFIVSFVISETGLQTPGHQEAPFTFGRACIVGPVTRFIEFFRQREHRLGTTIPSQS